jgi:hypothetical protein
LCAKTKKVVFLGKFDVLVELAVATQPTAEKTYTKLTQKFLKRCVHTLGVSQTTPLARQRCIKKLLLLVYCVFLCAKTKKK